MNEDFPRKKPGDPLTAEFINKLGAVAGRVSKGNLAGYLQSFEYTVVPPPNHIQRTVVVTDGSSSLLGTDIDENGVDLNQPKVRTQYWYNKDPDDENDYDQWKENEQDTEIDIDYEAVKYPVEKGDILTAYWHSQRNKYVPIITPHLTTVIPIKNDSGADRKKYDVLAIDETMMLNNPPNNNPPDGATEEAELRRFKDQICFVGKKPTDDAFLNDKDDAPYFKGRFCVLQSDVDDGKIGWGMISGITACRVHIRSGDYVHPEVSNVGSYTDEGFSVIPLVTSTAGAGRVLYKKSTGSGDNTWAWAVIALELQHPFMSVHVTLDEDLTPGGTAKASLVEDDDVMVHDDLIPADKKVTKGSNIWISWQESKWWFAGTSCTNLMMT